MGSLTGAPSPWHLDELPPGLRIHIGRLLHKWRAKDAVLYEELRWDATGEGSRVWVQLDHSAATTLRESVLATRHLMAEWRAERPWQDLQEILQTLADTLTAVGITGAGGGLATAVCPLQEPARVTLSTPEGLLTLSFTTRFRSLRQASRAPAALTASARWSACSVLPALQQLPDLAAAALPPWLVAALSQPALEAIGRALHPVGFGGDGGGRHLWLTCPDKHWPLVRAALRVLSSTPGLPFAFDQCERQTESAPPALCNVGAIDYDDEPWSSVAECEWRHVSATRRRVWLLPFSLRTALSVDALSFSPSAVPVLADLESMLQNLLLPFIATAVASYLERITPD